MEQNEFIDTYSDVQNNKNGAGQAGDRRFIIGLVVVLVILLVITIISIVFLLQPTTDVARIRDMFIIFMGLQSLLIGFVLVLLMIQLARLINLLQNEISPILESTIETVSNLRGTTTFLGDHLVEPVIKLNEQLAGLTQLFVVLGLVRRRGKKNTRGEHQSEKEPTSTQE